MERILFFKKGILDTDKDRLTRIKKIICFACGEKGHIATRKPVVYCPDVPPPLGDLN